MLARAVAVLSQDREGSPEAALNVVDALLAAPREFAFLLDAMGGLALEHVDTIAVARLGEPEG